MFKREEALIHRRWGGGIEVKRSSVRSRKKEIFEVAKKEKKANSSSLSRGGLRGPQTCTGRTVIQSGAVDTNTKGEDNLHQTKV